MSISLAWMDESKSEILCAFDGSWTWEEYHHALDEVTRMFPRGGERVSMVIDFTRSAGLPAGAPFAHARRAFKLYDEQPNYSGLAVVVTTNGLVLTLARVAIATRIARGMLMARSQEEAVALIRAKTAAKHGGR